VRRGRGVTGVTGEKAGVSSSGEIAGQILAPAVAAASNP
jgi:hypothetical protein